VILCSFLGGPIDEIRSLVASDAWDRVHSAIRCVSWLGRACLPVTQMHRPSMHELHRQIGWPKLQRPRLRLHLFSHWEMSGLVALAFWLLVSPALGQELDGAWFKANYLPAARKLEKTYGECTAKVSRTVTNDNSDDYTKTTYSFAFEGSRRKFDRAIESRDDGSTNTWSRTVVASPEVSFMVLTRNNGPLLEQVDRSPLALAAATEQIDTQAGESIYAPFALLDERVSKWIETPGFEIESVRRDGEQVRLDFRYQEDGRRYEGWISFLQDRGWVIGGWEASLSVSEPDPYEWRIATNMKYSDDQPIPALTGMTMVSYHPDRTDTAKIVVDELTFAPVPVSEFTLSRYGYDDRIGKAENASNSLWLWLAVGGGACLLSAFVIRKVMARRAAA